jgi:hypothetical protein
VQHVHGIYLGQPDSTRWTINRTGESTVKLSEAAATVIERARAIRAYWEAELPKRHPDYPVIHLGENSGPSPPEKAKLREFLADLPPETVYQLLLVMCLGRGDFDSSNLIDHFEQIRTTFPKPEWAISQMMEKAPLAAYLTDGLDKLKHSKINVDKLFTKASRTRK